MKHCSKCGKEISANEKYCKKCSDQISKIKDHKTDKKEYSIRLSEKTVFIAIGIIILLIFSFLVYPSIVNTWKSSSKDTTQEPSFKSYCGNKACERGEDSSSCCIDCGCPEGYSCDGTKCKKMASCGNRIKEEGETSENCCIDAGCPTGETCQNNVCVLLKPEISATFRQTTDDFYSVTFLKAKGDDIGQITLSNNGNDDANNVKIVLSSPNGYFSDKTINFGTIYKRGSDIKSVDLNFLDKALDVTTDEDITIKAEIIFYNSANKRYTSEESFRMHIAGRNYMTWGVPGMIASWVSPTQPTIREFASKATAGLPAGMEDSNPTVQKMAARWLFESMRAYGIRYVNDAHSSADYIQFPVETLRNKAGDCDDNAVLYASLLESIGLESFLVLVPGHIFSGYITSTGKAVPIETTASNFDSALSSGEYQYNKYADSKNLIYPTREWRSYPQVNLPEKSSLNMPSITKQIGDCKLRITLSQGFIAKMPVIFTNSGNAPGAGCAAMNVYDNNQQKIDDDLSCWTVNPGESKQFDYIVDISLADVWEGYYCYGY